MSLRYAHIMLNKGNYAMKTITICMESNKESYAFYDVTEFHIYRDKDSGNINTVQLHQENDIFSARNYIVLKGNKADIHIDVQDNK